MKNFFEKATETDINQTAKFILLSTGNSFENAREVIKQESNKGEKGIFNMVFKEELVREFYFQQLLVYICNEYNRKVFENKI